MIRLNEKQISDKISFINNYINAENAATASTMDANANVDSKNIATMEAELWKDANVQINRRLLTDRITNLYDKQTADKYISMLESHEIYTHDETSLKPYCVSLTMYPFLLDGLSTLGGESKAPKHLSSFCGSFVNFVFATSSQFAGAVATVEFLMYFDYFARKDYGDNYLTTNANEIANHLQHVIYAINQPAAARGYQSVFWNISIYDKPYFDAMFSDFKFPDFTAPDWRTVNGLQKFFMKWFNKERTKAILTYPVITAACLTDGTTMVDKDFEEFISEELSEGNSFFVFMSENAHALSSCCRLKNDVSDSINDFSYSLGAGGVSTGSINVITMNINRLVQDAVNHNIPYLDYIKSKVQYLHKFQIAYRSIIQDYVDACMLPVYTAGYISLDKQYLTLGINGLVEAAEFLGFEITDNEDYRDFISSIVTTISDENKVAAKLTGFKFNTEMVPAENLGVKNSKWDKKDGYTVPRDCYNSYNYKVEDESVSILEKFEMHGKEFMKGLDGGSAYHCNLDEYPSQEGFKKLLKVAATVGCEYFCFNIRITICNECNHIDKRTNWSCSSCGSKNIDHATRVIGYLKRVSAFSSDRQKEHTLRHYSIEK